MKVLTGPSLVCTLYKYSHWDNISHDIHKHFHTKTFQKKLNSINKNSIYPKSKILIYTNCKAPSYPNKFNKLTYSKHHQKVL